MENTSLAKLASWYSSNCDGEWEHEFGIIIETLDNPGWSIKIDFAGTNHHADDVPWSLNEHSDLDWFGFKIEDGTYSASGDPSKLEFLIYQFFKLMSLE